MTEIELSKNICKYCDRPCDPVEKCSRDDCLDIFKKRNILNERK